MPKTARYALFALIVATLTGTTAMTHTADTHSTTRTVAVTAPHLSTAGVPACSTCW